MTTVWDEEAIRSELARLDMLTGMKGAQLKIKFNRTKHMLASYSPADGGIFTFSKLYFMNPEWVYEEAIDVIRHEYAHYMNYVIYGSSNNEYESHGPTWKECCVRIGARLNRYYCEARADYLKKKKNDEKQLTEKLSVYGPGVQIIHPTFGRGVIQEVEGSGPAKLAVISFDSAGCKKLGLS